MNMVYDDDTLYVTVNDKVNEYLYSRLRKRVFNIVNDYAIEKIVLNLVADDKNNILVAEFIEEFNKNYTANITVKWQNIVAV